MKQATPDIIRAIFIFVLDASTEEKQRFATMSRAITRRDTGTLAKLRETSDKPVEQSALDDFIRDARQGGEQ